MAELVLVIAEVAEGKAKKSAYELLNVARTLATELELEVGVAVLGAGLDAEALAADLGSRGAEVLFVLEDEALSRYDVEPWAAALYELIEEEAPEVVLFSHSTIGRDVAPRLAGRLGAGLATDVTALHIEGGELRIVRPVYSGQALSTVTVSRAPVLITARPNTWAPAPAADGPAADIEEVTLGELPASRVEVLALEGKQGDRPDLSDASVIVAGGRGLQGSENFHLIEELADLLGAAISTTRAVVDAEWRPYEEQVGQTGKTVSPQLYLAVGISGAIQHLSGMRTSKTIVAINKDPDAPIFRIADYGIVGDLFQILPPLTQAVRELER